MRVQTAEKEDLLKNSDFVTVHVPAQPNGEPAIGKAEFDLMKDGAALVHCARGGVIDEEALVAALDSGKLSFAGLDVFVGEPTPSQKVLSHPKISVSPHIGAATGEAQARIGVELANLIIGYFKK